MARDHDVRQQRRRTQAEKEAAREAMLASAEAVTKLRGQRRHTPAEKEAALETMRRLAEVDKRTNQVADARKPMTKSRLKSMRRLEARIPTDLYEVMEAAAELRGLTLTAYVTATMGEDARRTIEENSIIRLSREAQIAFAKALAEPLPAPNAKLLAAAKRHAELTGE